MFLFVFSVLPYTEKDFPYCSSAALSADSGKNVPTPKPG